MEFRRVLFQSPILRWLQLPQHYQISRAQDDPQQWLQRLEHTLQTAIPHMVQFREPDWQQRAHQDAQTAQELQRCFERNLALCAQYEVPCLVNIVNPQSWWHEAQGFQLRDHDELLLTTYSTRHHHVYAY